MPVLSDVVRMVIHLGGSTTPLFLQPAGILVSVAIVATAAPLFGRNLDSCEPKDRRRVSVKLLCGSAEVGIRRTIIDP